MRIRYILEDDDENEIESVLEEFDDDHDALAAWKELKESAETEDDLDIEEV